MNDTEISHYITSTFNGVDVLSASGDSFFYYNPDNNPEADRKFPWATLVTSDGNDPFSNLNRPSVYRLNIGVSKTTFQALFGSPKPSSSNDGAAFEGYDYTALDQIMPHPVYGKMYWVSVLNPTDETLEQNVRPLLTEAYEAAVKKHNQREARG